MKMKKYIILSIAVMCSAMLSGQILSFSGINAQAGGESVFLDVTTNFSEEVYAGGQNTGKGLVFPTVDLTKFEFITRKLDGATFPTFFNGMIVYNRATGTTPTTGARSSTATDVKPGFYYFYNPDGLKKYESTGNPTAAIATGVWKQLGSSGDGSSSADIDNVIGLRGITIGGTDTLEIGLPTGKEGQILVFENTYSKQLDILFKQLANTTNKDEQFDLMQQIVQLDALIKAGKGDEWVAVDPEYLAGDSVFVERMTQELYNDEHLVRMIDSLAQLIREGNFDISEFIQQIVNEITQEIYITQMGDSLAYYFSETVLGDTIANYLLGSDTYITNLLDTLMAYLDDTNTLYKAGYGLRLYKTTFSVNFKQVADSLTSEPYITQFGDSLVNNNKFITNLIDTLVNNSTFVTNLGDEITNVLYDDIHIKQMLDSIGNVLADALINGETNTEVNNFITEIVNQISQDQYITQLGDSVAYYFSETALRDTISKYLLGSETYITNLIDTLRAALQDDENTLYSAGYGLNLDGTVFSANIGQIADSLTSEPYITQFGDSLINNNKFITNLIDTLVNNSTFVTNLGDEITNVLYDDIHIKQLLDSIGNVLADALINGDTNTEVNNFITEVVNQITQQQYITQINDSVAYYFSETSLSDTVLNYVTSRLGDIINLNYTQLGDSIAYYFSETKLGDTILQLITNGDLLPPATDGQTLIFNGTTNKWEAGNPNKGETIWLPSTSFPWGSVGEEITVDMFDVYSKAFKSTATYGSKYYSSTGSVLNVPFHTTDVKESFHYVITDYDDSAIEIMSVTPAGGLKYKIKAVNSGDAWINILLVRK